MLLREKRVSMLPPMCATLLALASLLCAAFKDLSFRMYAGTDSTCKQKNGTYIAVIGLTWCFACGIASIIGGDTFGGAELLWGAAVGLSGGISNILLAHSMARCGTAVCSTMYRLNLVPAALLMIFLFDEPSNLMTWIGIGVAAVAVFFFSDFKLGSVHSGFALLCLASLCRAFMGVSMKAGIVYGASTAPCLCVAGAVWFLCGFLWDRQIIPDRRCLAYGLVSGVLTIGVAVFLYLALSMGNGAVIIPLSQLSFALTALLAWVILKEGLNLRQGLAITCSIAAIVFLGVFG